MKAIAVVGVTLVGLLGLFLAMPFGAARASESVLQQQLIARERAELDALKAGNVEAFGSIFAGDTVFLDSHGFASKAEVLEHTSDFKVLDYSMDDVKVIPLDAKSGLIAYKLTQKVSSHGKEFSTQAYASAVWVERSGKWVCIFTQETPAKAAAK